jgi:hypothetical protein
MLQETEFTFTSQATVITIVNYYRKMFRVQGLYSQHFLFFLTYELAK